MVNNKVISSSFFSFGQATLVVPCQAKCSFKSSFDLDPVFYTKFNMKFEIRFQNRVFRVLECIGVLLELIPII